MVCTHTSVVTPQTISDSAAVVQDMVEVGGEERALAGLVDDDLALLRRELGHDVMAVLAVDGIRPMGP